MYLFSYEKNYYYYHHFISGENNIKKQLPKIIQEFRFLATMPKAVEHIFLLSLILTRIRLLIYLLLLFMQSRRHDVYKLIDLTGFFPEAVC